MSEPCVVLVVDDESDIRDIISTALDGEDYRVLQASNGEEALLQVEGAHPQLVLLDMRMPVMDGWAFTRALRERNLKLPICVMTAAQDARQSASEIGADSYLGKPFSLNQLFSVVDPACC
jgi:CheY-like chemotaxis protein